PTEVDVGGPVDPARARQVEVVDVGPVLDVDGVCPRVEVRHALAALVGHADLEAGPHRAVQDVLLRPRSPGQSEDQRGESGEHGEREAARHGLDPFPVTDCTYGGTPGPDCGRVAGTVLTPPRPFPPFPPSSFGTGRYRAGARGP